MNLKLKSSNGFRQIRAYLQAGSKSALQDDPKDMEGLLRKLIAFRSTTGDLEATNASFDYIQQYLKSRGMHVRRYAAGKDNYGALVATTRRTKTPEVMLATHIDMITAPDKSFVLKEVDGKYYARGVYDMQLATAIYMKLVDDLQGKLADYDFGIKITADEELGGKDGINGFKKMLDRGYLGKVYVLPDGGENWQMETSAKGYIHYTLEAHGKTAHGSRPWEGENAVIKLMDALQAIREEFKGHGPATSTFNVGAIQGGEIANKIPHFAQADIETRPITAAELKRISKLIPRLCAKHDVQAVLRTSFSPITNSLDNPYLASFAASIKKITGVTCTGYAAHGGTDARFLAKHNVPCALVMPPGGKRHGDGEWLEKKGFYQLYDVIRDYLDKTAKLYQK